MRFITTLVFFVFVLQTNAQECNFFPADTAICGFKFMTPLPDDSGEYFFNCEEDKVVAISDQADGQTLFSFTECGIYEIIFTSSDDACRDTLEIEVHDASSSVTSLETSISLGYGDINCPENVIADCESDVVSISIDTEDPEELWSFCTTASCTSTTFSTQVNGTVEGCLAENIVCDTIITFDTNADCVDTNQDAFILLNSDGDMVDTNTFLAYLSQLHSALDMDCPLLIDDCFFEDNKDCLDSTIIDTSYIHIPVRIGGRWTLASIDTVELMDTTYFTYLGKDYELILDPGVEFYGPGDLNVYLYEFMVSTGNDTTRSFPYGFSMELQWEEDWIIDTLQWIREIPYDSDGDCFACGGNAWNYSFDVPDIPDFPCGPVSIDYPNECECQPLYPDYSIQLLQCEPKSWQFDVLNGDYFIDAVIGADANSDFNSTVISNPTSQFVTIILMDDNGCFYDINVDLESIAERVEIVTNGESNLSCSILSVELNALVMSATDMLLDFHSAPIWYLPSSNTVSGTSILATEPGDYILEYEDQLGCIHTDILSVEYSDEITETDDYLVLCGDGPVEYAGEQIEAAGEYTIEKSCDEIINLYVEEYEVNVYSEYYETCPNEEVHVYGYVLTGGNYQLEVNNGNACPDIVYVEVNEILIDATWNVEQMCDGEAMLSIIHNGAGANYSISGIGEFTNSENFLDVVIEQSGLYEVVVERQGCSQQFSIPVDLMEYEILPYESEQLNCTNGCVTLSPEIVNLSGAVSTSDYTIQWVGPDGFISTATTIEVCTKGIYNMQLSYGECTVDQDIQVTENYEPQVQTIAADLCYGECYDDGIYTFCQTTQSRIEIDECTVLEVDVNIAEELTTERYFSICEGEAIEVNDVEYYMEGEYSETLISESGCDSTVFFNVEVTPLLEEMPMRHLTFCDQAEVRISLNLSDNISYEWLDGYESEERWIATEGIYDVALTNGCNTVISTYRVEDAQVKKPFEVSNIFSPFGNVANAKMKVEPMVDYKTFVLRVFSRDGSLVYQSNDPHLGWDGKIGGSAVRMDSYVWLIEATIFDCVGRTREVQDAGTVMVIH